MKTLDIITEGNTPGGYTIPWSTAPSNVTYSTKQPAKPAASVPHPQGAVKKQAIETGKNTAGAIKNWLFRNKIADVVLETRASKAMGTMFQVMKMLNWWPFIKQYYASLTAIEGLEKNGTFTKTDAAAAIRMERERLVLEIASSNLFFNFINWFRRSITAGRVASKLIGLVITGFSAGMLGAVAVAEILATEYLAIKLQEWVQSPEGQDILTYCILYVIDPTVQEVYDMGPGKFFGAISRMSEKGKDAYTKKASPAGDPEKSAKVPDAAKPAVAAVKDVAQQTYDKVTGKDSEENPLKDLAIDKWGPATSDAAKEYKPAVANSKYTPPGFRRTAGGQLIIDPDTIK